MNDELLSDLERLGTLLERLSTPVTIERITDAQHHPLATPPEVAPIGARIPNRALRRSVERRPSRFVSIGAALAVAASLFTIWVVTSHRASEQVPTDAPAASLPTTPTPNKIDNFPILADSTSLDGVTIGGSWAQTVDDQGWTGYLGVPGTTPTSVIAVRRSGPSSVQTRTDGLAGRNPGVTEFNDGKPDGLLSLTWTVNGQTLALTGANIDTLYAVLAHVQPIEATAQRGGYVITGTLPDGLVELDPPRHSVPEWFPIIGDINDSGVLNLNMDASSPLALLTTGDTNLAAVTVNGRPGFIGSREGHTDLAFPIDSEETVFMSSTTLNRTELIQTAEQVRFVDEATWRSQYNVNWGGDTDPAVGPTPAAIITTTTVP